MGNEGMDDESIFFQRISDTRKKRKKKKERIASSHVNL